MNKIKIIRAALIIAALSITTGCSDQITSNGESGTDNNNEEVSASSVGHGLPVIPTYKFKIVLKGHSRYVLNKFSTDLDKIYSIDITNTDITNTAADGRKPITDCNEILIYNIDSDRFLDCHSNGFDYSSLIIENTGASNKNLDIAVTGIKFVKLPPIKTKE